MWKQLLAGLCCALLLMMTAACGDTEPEADEMDTEATTEETDSEQMREEVMEEQFEEVTVLQRELTGTYRSDSLEAMVDFENRTYRETPVGGTAMADQELQVVDEGENYVTFVVGQTDTMTVSMDGDDVVLSEGSRMMAGEAMMRMQQE